MITASNEVLATLPSLVFSRTRWMKTFVGPAIPWKQSHKLERTRMWNLRSHPWLDCSSRAWTTCSWVLKIMTNSRMHSMSNLPRCSKHSIPLISVSLPDCYARYILLLEPVKVKIHLGIQRLSSDPLWIEAILQDGKLGQVPGALAKFGNFAENVK